MVKIVVIQHATYCSEKRCFVQSRMLMYLCNQAGNAAFNFYFIYYYSFKLIINQYVVCALGEVSG